MTTANRILVKLQSSAGMAAADPRANLRPLHDEAAPSDAFGLSSGPAWYVADLPDQAGPNPWDLAHSQVADQLGIDESAILFAEPDLPQSFNDGTELTPSGRPLAMAPDCPA